MTDLPTPEQPNINYGPKTPRVLQGLPAHLKDPKNYMKVQKLIIETLAGTCSHGEVVEWASCAKCQRRFAERSNIIKKLGFKSMPQYMAWQKIHQEIKNRMPLDKYNKLISNDIQI